MILLTAQEMRECDRATIEDLGIPGLVLMELAGQGCAEACKAMLAKRGIPIKDAYIAVVCGAGNNGGDGYVVARHMLNAGAKVTTYLLAEASKLKGDALANYQILQKIGGRFVEAQGPGMLEAVLPEIQRAHLLVDAVFGTGLARDLSEEMAQKIRLLDTLPCLRLAVDIPSGVDSDTGAIRGAALHADVTVTFGHQKRGHWLYPGRELCGEVKLVDISIPLSVTKQVNSRCALLTETELRRLLPKRGRTSHKNSFGHLLVVAGSAGMSGAALLSASAALRSGVGLASVATCGHSQRALEGKFLEAMISGVGDAGSRYMTEDDVLQIKALSIAKNALVLGPGIGQEPSTALLARRLVREITVPMLVDADGLNAVAAEISCLKEAQGPRVLTPHPKEMSRLSGRSVAEISRDRVGLAEKFAKAHNVVLVLKGADTVVASPDGDVYINSSGNSGLATAGSGDVLSGIIGSFLAQGSSAIDAARLGVYLHGAAADEAKKTTGEAAMVASDVVSSLPSLLRRLEESHA